MSIQVPAGVAQYQSPIVPVIAQYRATPQPTNQDQAIPFSIEWANSGGTGVVAPAVQCNIGVQQTVTPYGKIMAMMVDNTECTVDVQFLFPETNWKLTVPAGGFVVAPILALGINFYVQTVTPPSTDDVTNFTAFNFPVAPVGLQKTVFTEFNGQANVALAAGTTVLVANTVSGVLNALNIQLGGLQGAAAFGTQVEINDGKGNSLAIVAPGMGPAGGNYPSATLLDISSVNIPFTNGLNIVITITGTPAAYGQIAVNAYFSI
jgi:hypothetical protein